MIVIVRTYINNTPSIWFSEKRGETEKRNRAIVIQNSNLARRIFLAEIPAVAFHLALALKMKTRIQDDSSSNLMQTSRGRTRRCNTIPNHRS